MQKLRSSVGLLFHLLCQALAASNNFTLDDWLFNGVETNLANPMLGIPTPPPELDVRSTIRGPKLHTTSCLIVAVAALKNLALGDWEAKIMDGTEYRLDNYPEVSIVVSTPLNKRRRYVEARFVNYAITLGVYRMIRSKKFELAAFEITWNGDLMGWVHIVNNPPWRSLLEGRLSNGTTAVSKRDLQLPSAGMNDKPELRTLNVTSVITLNNQEDDDEEARLTTTFEPEGNNLLGIFDVFVPIMGALCETAPNPSTYRSQGLMEGLVGYEGAVCILPVIPSRTLPPFLEYRWVVRALARIPAYMLEGRRFGDIKMVLAVDGVPVASGTVNHISPLEPTAAAEH